jgi:hypothetical protein
MKNYIHPSCGISRHRKFHFLLPILLAILLAITVSASNPTDAPAAPQADLPDLVVTDVWLESQGQVCYQIHNIGAVETKSLGVSRLIIDKSPNLVATSDLTKVPLSIDERYTGCFDYYYSYNNCTEKDDLIEVIADYTELVAEATEDNNTHTETWPCDPPTITGPWVHIIDSTSVIIGWLTDDDSDSSVAYDRLEGVFGMVVVIDDLVNDHKVELSGLLPDTTYQYRVSSTDIYGNQAVSEPGYFHTLPNPDTAPPDTEDLSIERLPGDFVGYHFSIPAEDDQGIERVEFFLDGALIGMDFSPTENGTTPFYEMDFFPSMLDIPVMDFFTDHTLGINAVDLDGNEFFQDFGFHPPPDPFDGVLEILQPYPDYVYYSTAIPVPAGQEILLSAHAGVYEEDCRFAHVPGPGGEFLGCREYEDSVDRVEFYIDSDLICTTTDPGGDLYHECDWSIGGLSPDVYELLVKAYAGETETFRRRDIEIRSGTTNLSVERTLSRSGSEFTTRFTLRNIGTLSINVDRLTDNLVGLQPIHKSSSTYSVSSSYDHATKRNLVDIDCFQSGRSYYILAPGGTLTLEYKFVPALYPDLNFGLYSIGADPVNLYYYTGGPVIALPRSLPATVTDTGQSLRTAVTSVREDSDYLIVTNPRNLFITDPSSGDVNALLSAMADLATVKEGILGYLVADPGPDAVDDTLESWGDGMLGSDGVADHFLSNGYLLLVGELPIIPAVPSTRPGISHGLIPRPSIPPMSITLTHPQTPSTPS